jgi:hypothetical protein
LPDLDDEDHLGKADPFLVDDVEAEIDPAPPPASIAQAATLLNVSERLVPPPRFFIFAFVEHQRLER